MSHYQLDAVNCQQYAQQSPENMMDVGMMVVLSIQQNWLSVGDQLNDVNANGINSKFLWGNKINTYLYFRDNSKQLYNDAMVVINSKDSDRVKAQELMEIFLRVTVLGIPKVAWMYTT